MPSKPTDRDRERDAARLERCRNMTDDDRAVLEHARSTESAAWARLQEEGTPEAHRDHVAARACLLDVVSRLTA